MAVVSEIEILFNDRGLAERNKSNTGKAIKEIVGASFDARFEKLEHLVQKQTEQLQEQATQIEQLKKEVAKLKQGVEPEKEADKEKKYDSEARALVEIQNSVQKSPLIFSSSSSSSPSTSSPSLYTALKPELKVIAEDVQKFLNHVAAGQQDEAETMLKQNRDLALAAGTVTDHAKRTFEDITGFQYAVWALDWHMWKMMTKYLPKEAAQEQAKGFADGSWVKAHGEHANWQKLIEAQQIVDDQMYRWDMEEVGKYWVQNVGGAQFLLPMHVLQEYNNPGRPFSSRTKFDTGYTLNRQMVLDKFGGLGTKYGIYRGSEAHAETLTNPLSMFGEIDGIIPHDRMSLTTLLSARIKQRGQLIAELERRHRPAPS